MAQPQVSTKKQQGSRMSLSKLLSHSLLTDRAELQQQYTTYKNNLQQLAERIGNVEQETEEHKYVTPTICWPGLRPTPLPLVVVPSRHSANSILTALRPVRLVLETLTPLPGDRKCFRLINGVLVERTVKDVLPALQTNSDGLKKVLNELVKQYKRQQEEMDKWKVRGRPSQAPPRAFSSYGATMVHPHGSVVSY